MKKFVHTYILDRKWLSRYLIILLVASLIPLLLIARYDHPCADDFSYGNYTVSTWRDTGSLSKTVDAAITGTKHVYQTWQGSFVAVFLMTLHPAIFGEHLYVLVPILLIVGFIAAMFFLLRVIMVNYWGADQDDYLITASIMTFLSLQFVMSPVEAFYWYNGAMYYTGFHILSLVLFATLLITQKTDKRHLQAIGGLVVAITAFLVGGSNFVTALTASVTLGLFFAYRLLVKRTRWLLPLLGLILIVGALLISAFAPGNAVRQENFVNMNPLLAIVQSFWYALRFVMVFVRVPVFFAFACLTPVLYRVAKGCDFSFRFPGLVTALLYGVFASGFTPNLYAMSSFGMARVVNVNYYEFLLFLFITIFYWCGWISKKLPPTPASKGKGTKAKKEESVTPALTGLLAACFVLGCVIISSININAMTSVSALYSLTTGEARQYHVENNHRLEQYHNPEITQAEVPAFTVKPHVLFFDDITHQVDDWRNAALANYYGKDSVVLAE